MANLSSAMGQNPGGLVKLNVLRFRQRGAGPAVDQEKVGKAADKALNLEPTNLARPSSSKARMYSRRANVLQACTPWNKRPTSAGRRADRTPLPSIFL